MSTPSDIKRPSLPDALDPENIVHPEKHFEVPRTGWYRLWYKTRTSASWCSQRMVAAVVQKRYRQFTEAGDVRNLLIEKSPTTAHNYKGLFKPKYFYQKGF